MPEQEPECESEPEQVPVLERNRNLSVKAQVCGDASVSDKIDLEKMVSMRTYEGISRIDMVGTKSANNKFKFKHNMMTYYGRSRRTRMIADVTNGGTVMTTRVGSGIDMEVTVQYPNSIENGKGVSENIDPLDPKNIASIRIYESDILSREGVTRWFYPGMQSYMLSHRSESFNSGMSLKWQAWICFIYVYN